MGLPSGPTWNSTLYTLAFCSRTLPSDPCVLPPLRFTLELAPLRTDLELYLVLPLRFARELVFVMAEMELYIFAPLRFASHKSTSELMWSSMYSPSCHCTCHLQNRLELNRCLTLAFCTGSGGLLGRSGSPPCLTHVFCTGSGVRKDRYETLTLIIRELCIRKGGLPGRPGTLPVLTIV
jgi:hypothetical protein